MTQPHQRDNAVRFNARFGIPPMWMQAADIILFTTLPDMVYPLATNHHWRQRKREKRIPDGIPRRWFRQAAKVVEVAVREHKVFRITVRGPWTVPDGDKRDLVVVLSESGELITAWRNEQDDIPNLTSPASQHNYARGGGDKE